MQTIASPPLTMLSNIELIAQVKTLTANEREATAQLIACLAELDARRLYLEEGCSSLFTYCTQVLHLSEHATYGRIEAARAARRFPIILDLLTSGSLHLTAVSLLAPHLTPQNHQDVLAAAHHKSKREVEQLVAALRPEPPAPSTVRKLPTPRIARAPVNQAQDCSSNPSSVPSAVPAMATSPNAPACRADIRPIAPEHYKIHFTVSRETHDQLRLAQNLLRHTIPNGDVGAIFSRALGLLVRELQKTKHAATAHPKPARPTAPRGRHIPAAVKRQVWARDGGQCTFVGGAGRCAERGFLEYHHVVPFADGGTATVDNLALRCRAHNGYEFERWFGAQEEDFVRESPATYCRSATEMGGRNFSIAWSLSHPSQATTTAVVQLEERGNPAGPGPLS